MNGERTPLPEENRSWPLVSCTPLAIQRWHLLSVARACREDPDPRNFTMHKYGHDCGTPACALGHYAVRDDLQSDLALVDGGPGTWRRFNVHFHDEEHAVHFSGIGGARFRKYFGITETEALDLFEVDGCARAEKPEEAAAYIEAFVAVKFPQWSAS